MNQPRPAPVFRRGFRRHAAAAVALCAALPLLAGCAGAIRRSADALRPGASLAKVRDDVAGDMAASVTNTRRQVSRTWSEMWHDWNYTEVDSFSEIRTAAGHRDPSTVPFGEFGR